MLKGKHRVPYCTNCNRCQYIDFAYRNYYCCEENEPTQVFMYLGVDHPHKTSPKGCPKRKVE